MTGKSGDRSRYAINTYSFTMKETAENCIRRLADRGYVEFERMMYPGHVWPADLSACVRKELASLIERCGATVRTLNQPNVDINIAGATAEMRAYSLAVIRSIVELAGEIGVGGVIIGPGKANPLLAAPAEMMMGHFFSALDELVPLAARSGTSILVENMPICFLPDADGLKAG